MSEQPVSVDRKRQMMATFDGIAAQYDVLRFVQICARRLLELAELPPGAHVLDVGTGTGLLAMTAGELVGPTGRVVGVDLSPVMVAAARQKLTAAGIPQVEFLQGDAEHLDLPDGTFDTVFFASSLFFVPDMSAALREAGRLLAPGGCVAFTGFGESFFHPLRELWEERLRQHHLPTANPPIQRLADPAVCRHLLSEAGFVQVSVQSEQIGYYLPGAEQRWHEIAAGLEGLPLKNLPAELREQIHFEHMAELAAFTTPQGLWIDVPTHFALGRKSGAHP